MAGTTEAVKIDGIEKVFKIDNENLKVLDNVSFDVKPGEFISIVGASGCGKSTLLKLIVGLDKSTAGTISVGNRVVNEPNVDVGMVFQESRLFPWLTIRKNIEFGITNPEDLKNKDRLVDNIIELVGLDGFANAFPAQLSGGMQQRAAIARALIGNPRIILFDEPFGALDAFTRINMQNAILKIWERQKRTMILVTHDIDEAIFLSDRIVIMSDRPGKVKEVIDVNLARPRDRSNVDFLNIRKRILTNFLGSSDVNIEYYI